MRSKVLRADGSVRSPSTHPFCVIFRSNYKQPWIVKHKPSEQWVRFCKSAGAAEKIAHELNSTNPPAQTLE